MAHKSDREYIETTHNTARFFTEYRQIAWVLLIGTVFWGWYGYRHMPQRKDPDVPVRVATAVCPWPGAQTDQVEQLVTRKIEEAVAQNASLHPPTAADYGIRSLSMPGLAIVWIQLAVNTADTRKEFNDINLKLTAVAAQLPQGAGPIQFNSDFGDTAALMLTVASPPVGPVEIGLRAQSIAAAITQNRAAHPRRGPGTPVTLVYSFPPTISRNSVQDPFQLFAQMAEQAGIITEARLIQGPGFVGLDGLTTVDDARILAFADQFIHERLHQSEIHPDAWGPAIIRDPAQTRDRLAAVAGDKYSYEDLDHFTDLIGRALLTVPQVSKVQRAGVLPQTIYLNYSQERLASYGLDPSKLGDLLSARNITLPGGAIEAGGKSLVVTPTGTFVNTREIGNVIIGATGSGSPVYLRDLVDINQAYQSPARFLNYYTWRDKNGVWHRDRAVTLAAFMRSGEQVSQFGRRVDEKLATLQEVLPHDLVIAHTSDQPRQVKENIDLFMTALEEAIVLVILVSLVGFWDWRSAVLMALSIPITLTLAFGMMNLLKIDLQQVSIATLIIALGLLVDDPVVAGDAIRRSLGEGHPRLIASWLGPTRLAHAIFYATVTNVFAYLPFLLLTGDTGKFLYSLPVVMTCALVASRIVSMTFVPLLGYFLLRPSRSETPIEVRRERGFTGFYYRVAKGAIEHRWLVFGCTLLFLLGAGLLFTQLKPQFFPDDVQYLSYIDVWLPNDAALSATNQTTREVEQVARRVIGDYGRQHPGQDGRPRDLLVSMTSFIGGGGPRFWMSVSPQLQQPNYAQVVLQVRDKNVTPELVGEIQRAVSAAVPGAIADVRQLQTNPVEMPIAVRVSSQTDVSPRQEAQDNLTLRQIARRVEDALNAVPAAARVRTDWREESPEVRLDVDPDRANLAGITNADVARSSMTALSGVQVTIFQQGDRQVPVVARLRMEQRAQISDLRNLYVYSSQGTQKVPITQVATVRTVMAPERIDRLEHFRTITVQAFPAPGVLASQVLKAAMPGLQKVEAGLPPGYRLQISGEYAKQQEGFRNLAVVLAISIFAIFLALVLQFKHAIKPLVVFAATPYGIAGAILALWLMNTPFGFMAFLGIASLIGVIVSHVIVLFDLIEEAREKGEDLEQALLDAGIQRLRPVMITVGATILALFPLALHGGPLWQPLCYAQIGGLAVATFITLLLVPVLYSIAVMDLKLIRWLPGHLAEGGGPLPAAPGPETV